MKSNELYDALEYLLTDPDGKFGGNLLGQYIYFNAPNDPDPAIGINYVDPDVKVYGLECVIPLVGEGTSSGTDEFIIQQEKDWDILLVQRSPPLRDDPELYAEEDEPKLPQAIERIERVFAFSYMGTVKGYYTGQDSALGSYPQYRFTLTTEEFEKVHHFVNQLRK